MNLNVAKLKRNFKQFDKSYKGKNNSNKMILKKFKIFA